MDPFKLLGVNPGVSEPELTAAYRRLAKRWHPDRRGDATRMTELNAAYAEARRQVRAAARQRAGREPAVRRRPEPGTWLPDAIRRKLGWELLAALGEGEDAPRAAEAREVAWRCSELERDSMRVERAADDICAAFLLERERAERGREAAYAGEVSGVIRSGAFIAFGGELGDVYEGFLPARRMPGDFYELNATETALVGRRDSGRVLRLGDPVSVTVSGVEAPRGRVDLDLGPEPAEG